MTTLSPVTLALLVIMLPLGAQSPGFEVASVNRNVSGDRGLSIFPPAGGRFKATNVPLGRLIETAYEVEAFQISGGPRWLNDDRFDIDAKAQGNPGLAEMRVMLQGLLADRFKLPGARKPAEN